MIDQFHPVLTLDHYSAVANALKSGWINEGEVTREFEKQFAETMGTRYAIACTSGSVALFLALKALDKQEAIEIPDYTFGADPNMAIWVESTPVLKDVDSRGLLYSRYSPQINVAMNGRFPSAWFKTGMIEDRSQALGRLGLRGEMGTYSLAASKHLTTGQGGMVTTDSEKYALRLRRLKNQGRLDSNDDFPENGFNFKLTDMQSSLGLVELANFKEKSNKIWKVYMEYESALGEFMLRRTSKETPWYVDIYVDDPEKLAQALRNRQIGTRRHYKPLHTQPAFKQYGNGDYLNSQWFYDHGLYLPSSEDLTSAQIEEVCKVIDYENVKLPKDFPTD